MTRHRERVDWPAVLLGAVVGSVLAVLTAGALIWTAVLVGLGALTLGVVSIRVVTLLHRLEKHHEHRRDTPPSDITGVE